MPYWAHFFFTSTVQLVMTFRGRELVSGAVLPINRWPSFASTSKMASTGGDVVQLVRTLPCHSTETLRK
jgi:hypothetical protein